MGTLSTVLPVTFSKGNVTVASSNVANQPIVSLNWFSDPADMELMLTALKRLRYDIWNTSAAAEVKMGPETWPGEDVVTDDEMMRYIRAQTLPIWHACGTCAMGQRDDTQTVVDSKGRVVGVQGSRVCDASVFPFAIPAHPQAGVYALAEKIATDILRAAYMIPCFCS
ncbi:Versicolorin B synthase [Cytospora mali]|uniref:Versicolorin B synthase n=1 Tax=Cytospora mali TaxID=578113 RepID=A0A194VKC1_CYTMA|nr:Versicolorin B synthase [Valsa mali]